jgi:ComF family protein
MGARSDEVGLSSDRRLRDAGKALARGAARKLADLVVPPACLACRQRLGSSDAICGRCWAQIHFIRPPLCDRLGIPMPFDPGGIVVSGAALKNPPVYDRARAVARFDSVMRRLIHSFKYGDRHDARRLFARWLAEAGGDLLRDAGVLVPVPLHRWRFIHRRFNQAAILTLELASLTGLPCAMQVLRRARPTRSQVGLSHTERKLNLAGAFAVAARDRQHIEGRNIVLIDDVITTGSTVSACAAVLKRAGAARVDVLALALVTDDSRIDL